MGSELQLFPYEMESCMLLGEVELSTSSPSLTCAIEKDTLQQNSSAVSNAGTYGTFKLEPQ